jgi:hypothetical protein
MPLNTVIDGPLEQIRHADDVLANPANHTFQALAVAAAVGVAARTGVFGDLAEGSAGVVELADRLQLQPDPLQMLLDVLVGQGLLEYRNPNYALSVRGRRWLHPASPMSVTTFLSHTLDYWNSWADLEQAVTGHGRAIAFPAADDDAAWSRYTRADYESARLISDDIALAINLSTSARSLLDLGGGHGWYAASFCKRNPRLRATVIDTAGAVAIGREIMWETDMDRAVTHQVGDFDSADLGGPHDGVLYLGMTLDLSAPDSGPLLRRIRAAMRPGAVFAILQVRRFEAPVDGPQPSSAAAIDLFRYLHGGARQYAAEGLTIALTEAGFAPPSAHQLPSCRDLVLYAAQAT